jgi:tetratricopeptide (TPR) repeat protein
MRRGQFCFFFAAIFIGLGTILFCFDEILERQAQQSMDIMNYSQAISAFEQVLVNDPNKKNIRTKMAFCHFRLEEYDRAVGLLNEELAHFPDDLIALILLGFIHYQQGAMEETLEAYHRYAPIFEEYIKQKRKDVGKEYGLTKDNEKLFTVKLQDENPNYGLPFYILGLDLKKKGVHDRAKAYFENAVQAGYDPVAGYCQLIDIELEQKNWTQALVRARRAQRAAGNKSEFYFLIGYAYDKFEKPKYAISSLKKSIELKSYLVEAVKNLGIVHYNLGQFKEASPLLEQVLKLVPYDFETKFLLERMGKEQAIHEDEQKPKLSKAIIAEKTPKFRYKIESDTEYVLDIINRSAISLVRLGELDSAIGLLQRFLDINDHWPGIDYNLALVYNMKKELLKALEHAWIAVDIKKNFRDAHDLLGNIYFKLEDYENALRAYESVVSIDKTDALGYYNLACTYAAIGEDAKAETNWKKAIHFEIIKIQEDRDKLSEDELKASLVVVGRRVVFHSRMSLGKMYANQKKWDKALEQFQMALELDEDQPELHFEIGKIYLENGDTAKARAHFEKYLYLGGEREKEVQSLLDKIKGGTESEHENILSL